MSTSYGTGRIQGPKLDPKPGQFGPLFQSAHFQAQIKSGEFHNLYCHENVEIFIFLALERDERMRVYGHDFVIFWPTFQFIQLVPKLSYEISLRIYFFRVMP